MEKLDPEIRESPSGRIFKKKLGSQIRPPQNFVYGIHNQKGVAYLTQLRVGLSKLNFHKFKHNFKDTINPPCPTNDGKEDIEHFLLICHSFNEPREVSSLLSKMYSKSMVNLDDNILQILSFGNDDFPLEANKIILNLKIKYLFETKRFD